MIDRTLILVLVNALVLVLVIVLSNALALPLAYTDHPSYTLQHHTAPSIAHPPRH